ncbi:Xylose isomerase domain-containing protein TIM barrel [Croceitalea dokdonensis DOKDO 023]|uniref:Xylose isomerase domain-containing protein TIM barrel n=1 Tax=Croceitalea dokdonensis DOKDO 023 TaxID=1300341 RepID=A0A0P7B3F1_9FLAO|nr:sugar phosphate isomerase/epimerase [Croceitalea dokdonensis]KPM33018.1 Xylose isomerase domain-containing protein TIM barrel [Croceitalea dokdonensis DOKDO 023]
MNRRSYIKTIGLGTGAALLSHPLRASSFLESNITLGVQLFTIAKWVDDDLKSALALISELGYREVEFFGPYDFSTQFAKDRWNQIKPMLGIKNDAFYGYQIKEVKNMLADYGLIAPSMHTDLDTLRNGLDHMLDKVSELKTKYLVLPAIQGDKHSLDHYKRYAEEFNGFGEKMAGYDIQFVYHNHGYEHMVLDGQVPMDYLLENTENGKVAFELDIFWMQAAGADPVRYLEKYPEKYKLLHLKDAAKPFRFSGDGQTSDQWMAGFPLMSDPGDGVYDIKAIIQTAKKTGVEHYYLERDLAPDPKETLRNSYNNLKAMG